MEISTGVAAQTLTEVGGAEIVADTTKTAETAQKKPAELMPKPAVVVTEKGVAQMLLDSRYETAKNTIDNMVDSPEERREKEERRLEEEEQAARLEEVEKRADRNAALRQEDPASVSYI